MSGYQPANGDRVRVVIEGEAAKVQPLGFNVRGGSGTSSWVEAAHVVSVEKVEPPKPPLPTTPGSVVRWRDCCSGRAIHRMLGGDGVWYAAGDEAGTEPEYLADGHEVVFDAGAES